MIIEAYSEKMSNEQWTWYEIAVNLLEISFSTRYSSFVSGGFSFYFSISLFLNNILKEKGFDVCWKSKWEIPKILWFIEWKSFQTEVWIKFFISIRRKWKMVCPKTNKFNLNILWQIIELNISESIKEKWKA
jgi:hypothetical protein